MTQRSKIPQKQKSFEDNFNAVHVSSYEITYEPIHDRKYKRLPKRVKEAIDRLHYDSQRIPGEAIPELHDWIKKYPKVPKFYNYLAVAYSRGGDHE